MRNSIFELNHGARGSVTETQNHLEYGKKVGYFDKDLVEKLDRRLLKLYNDLNKIVVTLKNFKKWFFTFIYTFTFTYAFASYVEEGLKKTIDWYTGKKELMSDLKGR